MEPWASNTITFNYSSEVQFAKLYRVVKERRVIGVAAWKLFWAESEKTKKV